MATRAEWKLVAKAEKVQGETGKLNGHTNRGGDDVAMPPLFLGTALPRLSKVYHILTTGMDGGNKKWHSTNDVTVSKVACPDDDNDNWRTVSLLDCHQHFIKIRLPSSPSSKPYNNREKVKEEEDREIETEDENERTDLTKAT
uniref:Uncharacterized protein n=1 Tax=Trichuris muris TaxID=70415 RepID=A0A5S6Q7Z1_TRIMR